MNNYIIRDYRKEDYPQVLSIWETTGMGGKERGDSEHTIERSLQMGGKLLVLEKKSGVEIIGASWMTYNGRRIYLHHFGIKPEFQRKGLGYNLGLASIKFAQEKKSQIRAKIPKLKRKLSFNPSSLVKLIDFSLRDLYSFTKTRETDL
jgi:ribosomal-protein-alanine N-acetyltransferase